MVVLFAGIFWKWPFRQIANDSPEKVARATSEIFRERARVVLLQQNE